MQSQILEIIQQFPWLTVGELASRCELPSAAVSAVLRDLRKSEQVISTGNRRTTRYALTGTPLPEGDPDISETEIDGETVMYSDTLAGARKLVQNAKHVRCQVNGTSIYIDVSRASALRALALAEPGETVHTYLYSDGVCKLT